MGTARSSTRILRNPWHVSRTVRYGNMSLGGDVVVRYPQDNEPVLIVGIIVPPTMGNSGIQDIIKKRQYTYPSVTRNSQKFDASVDG